MLLRDRPCLRRSHVVVGFEGPREEVVVVVTQGYSVWIRMFHLGEPKLLIIGHGIGEPEMPEVTHSVELFRQKRTLPALPTPFQFRCPCVPVTPRMSTLNLVMGSAPNPVWP